MTSPTLGLAAGTSAATISRRGAEILSWQVGGRELIWHGDPSFWPWRAPVLFPVVGASTDAQVRVDGRSYPMPQHGFARLLDFAVVEHGETEVLLRLEDSNDTRQHYPFAFRFDTHIRLAPDAVHLRFSVHNTGDRPLPYALGYHPAFPWPFDREDRAGHSVEFDAAEEPGVPLVTASGLLLPSLRLAPLDGACLPLSPDLFEEGALVFRNARSRRMRFVSPSGAAIAIEAQSCAHLALWTKPEAPFLSMEAWTGHADWDGFSGDLAERDSVRLIEPGGFDEDRMSLSWIEPPKRG
jgi:galactose mutarotase-like enzyme